MILYDMKLNFGPFQPIFPSETLKNAPYDCKQNVPTIQKAESGDSGRWTVDQSCLSKQWNVWAVSTPATSGQKLNQTNRKSVITVCFGGYTLALHTINGSPSKPSANTRHGAFVISVTALWTILHLQFVFIQPSTI